MSAQTVGPQRYDLARVSNSDVDRARQVQDDELVPSTVSTP